MIDNFMHAYVSEECTVESLRFQAIIEGSDLGTWEWNALTGETIFNERWAGIVGYTLDELSPISIKVWKKLVHPEDFIESEKQLKKHFNGELDFYNLEIRMRHKNGHWVWVLDRGKIATWTDDGNPEWVCGTHQDISERKELQQQLKQREENFKAFFNSNIDFLWVLDKAGNIINENATVIERLGYSKEELKGKSILSVYPEDRREEAIQKIQGMLADTNKTCSIPIVAKDGLQTPVTSYIFPGQWDGKPAFFGTSRDISELLFSEEKFSKTFETNPAMSGLSDLDTGEYIEVNSAFYETLGFEQEDIVGRKAADIVRIDPEFRTKALEQLKNEGAVRNLETILYKKDGTPINVLASADVIRVQDKQYNYTTAINITEQKKAEYELRKTLNENKMLMKEMNHRIKNNLALVSSLIELEYSKPENEIDLSNLTGRIDAIGLIHETLYKTESFSHINIRTYLQSLLDRIFSSFLNNKVIINNNIEEIKLPSEMIIPIGLIVNETATNAVKYSFKEKDEGVFTIGVAETVPDKIINLTISNDGTPIPDKINLENPSTLGLQLIKSLTLQLNGKLSFKKKPHPEFQFEFPRY